ncbi:hypothetical protein NPX13_g7129 [Xylaria arbuscula]|uniref:Protein kinase domain-containing protein n=1 Tax=Xylaria arbuscula TaxID=114810 RepID=A0A9W8NB72_9PEZI|nr:hypothetical protein NPX13_g7129 [Xylaria arbuscula]
MAQANNPRAVLLNQYFANEFGFYFERQIAGNIIYRRLTQNNVVERIVAKFPIISGNPWLNQQMREDASALFRLWGSEHNLRILSIVRNKVYAAYREPTNRPLSNPIITPWWLHIDPQVYGVTADFTFFVTEYLPRGTGLSLIGRCEEQGIASISEPLLWCFFLCLTRACVGMAIPPNHGPNDPLPVEREILPQPGRRPGRLAHMDLHIENIMFGDCTSLRYEPAYVIDFGRSTQLATPKQAAQYNLSGVGNLMHQLATLEVPDPNDVVFPPVNNIQNSLGLRNFKTQASREFIESQTYSEAFRSLVCMCMADDETEVPGLRGVLFECQRHVNAIGDWTILANEIRRASKHCDPATGSIHSILLLWKNSNWGFKSRSIALEDANGHHGLVFRPLANAANGAAATATEQTLHEASGLWTRVVIGFL